MSFSPDGRTLLTGNRRGDIRVWSLDRNSDALIGKCFDQVLSVAFRPGGHGIVATDRHGAVRTWSPSRLTAHTDSAEPAAVLANQWRCRAENPRDWCGISADGRMAATCRERLVSFRDFTTGRVADVLYPEDTALDSVEQSRETLCREILALTKMNWNNTQFDMREPITLRAARGVGDILKYIPPEAPESRIAARYSFYM